MSIVFVTVLVSISATFADKPLEEATWAQVDLGQELPVDLVEPEGKTRWDLRSLVLLDRQVRSVAVGDKGLDGLQLLDRPVGTRAPGRARATYVDPAGESAAERWLLPHRDPDLLKVSGLAPIELRKRRGGEEEHLWIQTQRAGLGWVLLPSGPREVVLQRALVMRRASDDEPFVPDRLIHRWVDPRGGVVAEVGGPVSFDGRRRIRIDDASVAEGIGTRQLGKLYADEADGQKLAAIRFGYDREKHCTITTGTLCRTTDECGGGSDFCAEIPISTVDPAGHSTIGELACDADSSGVCQTTSWDFSGNNLVNYPDMEELASFNTDVSADETSAYGECGFSNGTRKLSREDKNYTNPNLTSGGATFGGDGDWNITASVIERTDGRCSVSLGPCTSTPDCPATETCDPDVSDLWLRAAIRNEGTPGADFRGESRTCHDPATGRTPVPLWSFANHDAGGNYAQVGDTWANPSPFDCEQTIFADFSILGDEGLVKHCSSGIGNLSGEQRATVINEGPVTLPSGHTFNAFVLKNAVEYCVYREGCAGNCGGFLCGPLQEVRTILYLWEVPHIGTVARLMSNTAAPSQEGFTTLDETDIKYGLFPPVSVTAVRTSGTGDSVDVSWDPGSITSHIDRYKIYWDTVSGATTGGAYAFDSDAYPGQVSFNGTSATISGLSELTPYYFTVTSVTEYCPPADCDNNPCSPTCPVPSTGCGSVACNDVHTFESLIFPLQVSGGPSPIPAEVSATPACVPEVEVGNLTLNPSGGNTEFCWDLIADPCNDGYRILHASSPESASNFSAAVSDTGLVSCHTFSAPEGYFLVTGKGTGGGGPWGHFGQ